MNAWTDLPAPASDLGTLKSDLDRFGYCLVAGALGGGLFEALRERTLAQMAAERARGIHRVNPPNPDPNTQWSGMLLNKGAIYAELFRLPIMTALAEHLLGPDWMISACECHIQHPGTKTMALHTDQWWMPPPRPPSEPHARPARLERDLVGALDPSPAGGPIAAPMAFNVLWPLNDFTEANGATRVVPGSHLSGLQPNRAVPHPIPTIAAAVPAGTGIAFDARLWHAAGPNTSDGPRIALGTLYCAPQTRPLENHVAGLRADARARLDDDYLRRLGFGPWHAYGNVGDPFANLVEPGSEQVGELTG